MSLEFRVRWQREGRNPTYRIYQSWNSACQKVRGIKAMDTVKTETERFADMPDAIEVELQVREVGEWRRHDYQPKATDRDRESLKEHLYYRYGEGAPKDEPERGEVPF